MNIFSMDFHMIQTKWERMWHYKRRPVMLPTCLMVQLCCIIDYHIMYVVARRHLSPEDDHNARYQRYISFFFFHHFLSSSTTYVNDLPFTMGVSPTSYFIQCMQFETGWPTPLSISYIQRIYTSGAFTLFNC